MNASPSRPPAASSASRPGELARRLGTADAAIIGVGSMIGAGVFAAFAPAAAHAGALLPVALLLAAAVAWCNATSTAQLAMVHPASGGTYVYANRQLGPWAGFAAGWGFVTGKTASAAGMSMAFGLYAASLLGLDDGTAAARALAVAAIVVLTGVNLGGITRTAGLTRILVSVVLLILAVVAGLTVAALGADTTHGLTAAMQDDRGSALGVLPAAGLLFFAFAGYARVATMGEEVRDPQRTIPRAILGALAFVLVVYLLLAVLLLGLLGAGGLAASSAPFLAAAQEISIRLGLGDGASAALAAVVTLAAAAGALGALLALIAGVSRTSLAMSRERDLPRYLRRISSRQVPWASELTTAVIVIALIVLTDLHTVIGFSSFGVLVYYALANLSAVTLHERPRWAPRALNIVGLIGCLLLAFSLPWQSVAVMLGIFAVGLAGRALVLNRRS
ncbi:APC family permease [Kocuria sp. p3-SID1433]|uniref:APC family permease n=1 Tax=unclassified Kocuria TaxID=2649579 RepID=UPI0021A46F35|nr:MULTISPECIES: APC family permease [unclassified Kocuria]MCT1600768.1 APC family permease [Kocuria sp. p3-SID1428]MCT2179003.1 APC family permease [Kocuria sp. p3-SID1433]